MARAARPTGMALIAALAQAGWASRLAARARGWTVAGLGVFLLVAAASYNAADPSWNAESAAPVTNLMGGAGAALADGALQSLGLAAWVGAALMVVLGLARALHPEPDAERLRLRLRALSGAAAVFTLAGLLAAPRPPAAWPLAKGLGGFWGDGLVQALAGLIAFARLPAPLPVAAVICGVIAALGLAFALDLRGHDLAGVGAWLGGLLRRAPAEPQADSDAGTPARAPRIRRAATVPEVEPEAAAPAATPAVRPPKAAPRDSAREARERQGAFEFAAQTGFRLPELGMLAKAKPRQATLDGAALTQNAKVLENVLSEYGVRGHIGDVHPGPVVTLYELVPAPGVKHSRVVALADDIARSMGVAACRVAVVSGRNAIGIELPNQRRETVYLRDLLTAGDYEKSAASLPMALGETIGGQPYIADLAKMPHLLIAGTTGSGKSVGVNAMILSILYKLPPEQCRFIMVDPKMLELSVYDGIPHLLAPVVTDPKKAIVALKWTVREMEDRYRRMQKIGVRNIAGFNERVREALAKGEHFERTVQTGFDEAHRPVFESEKIVPEPIPYLVVVIDEVADLMMVAGKDIEAAIQRLAQMARAAGIHLIMATQRPSVDVITGTIKANFPTRISFQVTSRIDARTILNETGAEQLLGQGDMLYMTGGSRITRLHGPFVSDGEVEAVASFLRAQGEPQYLEEVTAGGDDENGEVGGGEEGSSGDDLYDRAVAVVTRDGKASTSYVQRQLQIGYNRAANLIDRMEREGVVGPANHAGKREILAGAH